MSSTKSQGIVVGEAEASKRNESREQSTATPTTTSTRIKEYSFRPLRRRDDVQSEVDRESTISETSSDNSQFLVLAEDHFSTESAYEDNLNSIDSEGLPLEKRDIERAICRYIRLIRLEEEDESTVGHDSETKKKLVTQLRRLKRRLSQMNEEMQEKYFNGHRLNRSPKSWTSSSTSSSPSTSTSTTSTFDQLSPSSSLMCDVCLKKQTMILLPSGLFKSYQPNVVLACDFCDFKIHRNCINPNESSNIRRCPQALFQEELDQIEEQEEQLRQQKPSELFAENSEELRSDTHLNRDDHESSFSPSSSHTSTPNNYTSNSRKIEPSDTPCDQLSMTSITTGTIKKRFRYSKYVEFSICPEIGLSKQDFKCAECQVPILLTTTRLCDYDGLYYCFKCHWNDVETTPARMLHNWDSTPRPVSRRSLQIITYIKRKPILFDVLDFNPMLYGLVEDLPLIKRIRHELSQMSKYIRLCRQPNKPKLLSIVPSYLFNDDESNGGNAYSLTDLLHLDSLKKSLIELHGQLLTHITVDCEGCRGKGFYCNHCRDKTDVLFPFTSNTSSCPECTTVYHRSCYHRKHKTCSRCQRRKEKLENRQEQQQKSSNQNVENITNETNFDTSLTSSDETSFSLKF